MSPRKLNVFIIILYAIAATCMLGAGSVRQQLQEVQTVAKTEVAPASEAQVPEHQEGAYSTKIEGLQDQLTIWQIATIVFFAAASLLLMFKEKLVKV